MIQFTQIARLDGLILSESVDDGQSSGSGSFATVKGNVKNILRRLNRNSEPKATIESGLFNIHYLIRGSVVCLCICEKSYPRKLAFTYLSDIATEFENSYPAAQISSSTCRPYSFMEFDTFIQKTKKTYQDARATQNLEKLNDELKDVTKVMTKNIEDLLYRGDSLERIGDMSSRLLEDSRKYRKSAVRINWRMMISQYGPIGAVCLVMGILIWARFF